MFHKSFRIKSNSAIKGSVRKQLKREVSLSYPSLLSQDLDSILPSKAVVHCVQYESGKDGSVSSYYVLDDTPILFSRGSNLYPSVYTLWRYPHMIQSVTTDAFVIKKLSEGADLMLPGVFSEERGGFSLGGIREGQPLAVNIVGNRSAVAVGISLMSHDQMLANHMKGKLVETLHIYGDHLWLAGTRQELPSIPYSIEVQPSDTGCSDEEPADESVSLDVIQDQTASLTVESSTQHAAESPCPPSESCESLQESSDEVVRSETGEDASASAELQDTEDDEELEVDMDDLLLECFLKAVKSVVKPKDLPLLTSTLYGSIMMQVCPSDLKLDIKQSSYKKVSRFLGSMAERGVLAVSSEGGTDAVTSINTDHELVQNFRPVLTKGVKRKTAEAVAAKGITVDEVWSPTQSLAPIFSPHGVNKSSRVTASEVRTMVTQYVKDNSLTNQGNPQLVNLDPVLSSALKLKVDVTTIPWKQLFSLVFERMRASYIIHQGSSETIVKHSLPKVKLTVCRRANKTVTLVDNLDLYGIPTADVAHRIQRMAACHSAVHATPGGSGSQVLIQGNQVKSTVKILEDVYGLPVKFMEAQDNIKPPKKKGHKK